jgi:hypothetical protein
MGPLADIVKVHLAWCKRHGLPPYEAPEEHPPRIVILGFSPVAKWTKRYPYALPKGMISILLAPSPPEVVPEEVPEEGSG